MHRFSLRPKVWSRKQKGRNIEVVAPVEETPEEAKLKKIKSAFDDAKSGVVTLQTRMAKELKANSMKKKG